MAAGCADESPRDMSAEEVAGQLARMEIEPGLWELGSEVLDVRAPDLPFEIRERMIGRRSRMRHCITPEQAAQPSATFLAGRGERECAYRDFTVGGGRLSGSMTCPYARASMQGRYGRGFYVLRMEMVTPGPDGTMMTLDLRASGRRVGACDAGDEE